jgi:hypothetical protein
MKRKRARRIAWWGIAAHAAAVFFAAAAHAQEDRFPAGPENMFQPGAAFRFYDNASDLARIEGLKASLNIIASQDTGTAETVLEIHRGIETGVAAQDADTLARSIASSIDGTFAIMVQAGFLRALTQTDPTFGRLLQTAQMDLRLPDGRQVMVPVLMAAAAHSLTVAAAGEKLRDDPALADMSGVYSISTRGDCAVADGALTVTQNDFVIEATGGDALVLYGTIGHERAYLIANERRYATITGVADGPPRISVPDRPSDLFEGTLAADGTAIEFQSVTRGTCAFSLAPAR